MTRITRILVPTDFSATADAALDYAFVLPNGSAPQSSCCMSWTIRS